MTQSYSQKIAYNTVFQVIGKIITAALSLVLIAYLTRYLGVFGFGEYTTVFVYLSFFGVIADFGFFNILVREIAKHPEQEQKIADNLLTFRALFALIIYGLSILIALFLPYSSTIKIGIAVVALASVFGSQNSSLVGIFQARHKMDRAVLSDVLSRLVILLLSIWLIKINAGLQLIFSVVIVGNLVNLSISYLLMRPYLVPKIGLDFSYWRTLFVEAWPLGIAAIFGVVYFKIDSVMLSFFRGSVDVGIYGAPYKILENLLFVPAIFMGNVFPVFSRYLAQNDDRIKMAVQKSLDFLALAGVGLFFGGFVLSEKIIRLMAGEEFVTASTMSFGSHPITAPILLQILLFAMMLSFISFTFNPIIVASDKQRHLIAPAIYATILNIGLNLLLIPYYGYLAAALTTVITELFILIYLGALAGKILGFFPQLVNLVKIIIAGIIMAASLFFLHNLNLFILIILGIIVYCVSLFVFGVLSKRSILEIINRGDE